jgi:predicted Fe-S protein YdhL (DUF1289 family)
MQGYCDWCEVFDRVNKGIIVNLTPVVDDEMICDDCYDRLLEVREWLSKMTEQEKVQILDDMLGELKSLRRLNLH